MEEFSLSQRASVGKTSKQAARLGAIDPVVAAQPLGRGRGIYRDAIRARP